MQKRLVKVKPRSSQQKVTYAEDGSLIVHLKSPPVDGKANEELLKVLAQSFKVSSRQIRILSGQSARTKIVEIDD